MSRYEVTDEDVLRYWGKGDSSEGTVESRRIAGLQAVVDHVLSTQPTATTVELDGWPAMQHQTAHSLVAINKATADGWHVHTAQFMPDGSIHALLEREYTPQAD